MFFHQAYRKRSRTMEWSEEQLRDYEMKTATANKHWNPPSTKEPSRRRAKTRRAIATKTVQTPYISNSVSRFLIRDLGFLKSLYGIKSRDNDYSNSFYRILIRDRLFFKYVISNFNPLSRILEFVITVSGNRFNEFWNSRSVIVVYRIKISN